MIKHTETTFICFAVSLPATAAIANYGFKTEKQILKSYGRGSLGVQVVIPMTQKTALFLLSEY